MQNLLQFKQIDIESNALAALYKAVMIQLGENTLAVISTVNLAAQQYQISSFCDDKVCPIYSPAELLDPSESYPIYPARFIQQWKQCYEGFHVNKAQTPELFANEFADYEQAIVIPICHDGLIERWIVILKSAKSFANVELEKLLLTTNLVFSNIARAEEKRQLIQANKWIDRELEEIANLQSLLLPENHQINIPGVETAFQYRPYREASGDYFNFFSFTNAHDGENFEKLRPFGCIIADVTGHGPSAAFEAAMLDAILRTYDADKLQDKDQGGGPAAVVEYVNKYFFTSKLRGKFITANLFYYDTNTRVLQYTSAGHPMSYVKRRGSQLICLDLSQGIPIGIMKDYQWSNGEIQLREGDILFMYTDVVLETRNAQDNEFGAARLESVIAASDACPHGVVDDVEQALYKFSGQNKLTDDLTLCAIQIKL